MTRPYAEVIGDPIAHSKSPVIHRFWLAKLGIDADYRTAHVKPEGLSDYIENRRADPLWCGCNVTAPHKIAVIDHVADPGDIHGGIGAMNTIARSEGGALFGTNTDAGGFYMPIADVPLEGQPVIVIGSGGAARAVLFALSRCGVAEVTVIARNGLAAAGLLARFGLKGQVKPMKAKLPPARLLVNTTTLGMKGQPPLEIDLSPLDEDSVVYDLIYAPRITSLLADADARGLFTIGGIDMLIGQARIGFELFFGQTPPDDCDDEMRALLLA
jgi:shikimate dehydrogenase